MFKKVIGQDNSETQRNAPPTPDQRSSAPTSAPPPPAYGSQQPGYGSQQAAAPAAASAAPARQAPAATRNVLSTDVEIKGTVKFTNDLVVDGKIEGEISSDGNLTVGENARIKAEVKTATVIVYGKVHGNMTATDRIELKASAEVVGDIKAKTLSIEAGAIFVGKSTVGTPANAPASSGQPGQSKGSDAKDAPKQQDTPKPQDAPKQQGAPAGKS